MLKLFFYSENLLLMYFGAIILLFGLEIAYISIYTLTYKFRSKKNILGEMLMLFYVMIIALNLITIIVSKRHGIITLSGFNIAFNIIFIMNLIYCIYVGKKYNIISMVGIILTAPFINNLIENGYRVFFPLGILILFLRLIELISVNINRQRNELNAFSINMGLDKLPAGIMFCNLDGYILLMNKKMKELAIDFINIAPRNANTFWDLLSEGNILDYEVQIVEGDILIRTPTKAWRFLKRNFKLKNNIYTEIIAIDETESIGAFYELEEENKKLNNQRIEIETLNKNIDKLRKEKEYIKISSKVHDVLGQRLTAVQRINSDIDNFDYNNITTFLYDAIENIKNRQSEKGYDLFLEISEYYKKIGLIIKVKGNFPKEENLTFLILSVLREASTNAIKHAGASKILLNMKENIDNYKIEITNNGTPPKESIIEGGGLFGMKNRVEDIGGIFKVELIPEFSLIITLMKG